MHGAYDPNPVVYLLDSESLTSEDGGEVDPLAMHADAPAGGDEHFAFMQRIAELRQAATGPGGG